MAVVLAPCLEGALKLHSCLQTRQRLPWFLDALPSEDCAKGGAGAYTDALQRSAKESSGIKVGRCILPSTTHLQCLV